MLSRPGPYGLISGAWGVVRVESKGDLSSKHYGCRKSWPHVLFCFFSDARAFIFFGECLLGRGVCPLLCSQG